jgi:hypothetical protein
MYMYIYIYIYVFIYICVLIRSHLCSLSSASASPHYLNGMAPKSKVIRDRPLSSKIGPHTSMPMPVQTWVKVFVSTPTGETIRLMLETSDNIGNVKSRLQDLTGIHCDKQVLIVGGRKITGCGLASTYGIRAGSSLRLEGGSVIEVTTTTNRKPFLGASFLVLLRDDDTFGDIKLQIQQKFGILVGRQTLRLHGGNGCELTDDAFVTRRGVLHGSILLLDDNGGLDDHGGLDLTMGTM